MRRTRWILALNRARLWFSSCFVKPQPKLEMKRASVFCTVLLYVGQWHCLRALSGRTHLSSVRLSVTCSSTRITFTWSKFFVVHRTTPCTGSTSLSSIIQLSAFDMIPRGAHLGRDPFFRMSRVVTSVPDGVKVREITSQEATCDAYGFG